MTAIEIGGGLAQLDAAIEALPNSPAVFLLWPKEGAPYLSRTNLLRRRLLRLLKERERPSRLLNLRHTACRIEFELTGSAFESAVMLYQQAAAISPTRTSTSSSCACRRTSRSCSPTGSRAATSPLT